MEGQDVLEDVGEPGTPGKVHGSGAGRGGGGRRRYPINLLSDLNAFLGIEDLHGTYLNGGVDGSGPTAEQIANAILLPGSMDSGTADSLTNYYMIDETAPLVSLLPKSLQDLLGPDLTYLINLGYGDGSLGYAVTPDSPANVPTPFGLFPDVSLSTVLSTLATDTQQGFQNLRAAPPLIGGAGPDLVGEELLGSAVGVVGRRRDPAATFTEFVNAISSAASTLYSTLLPTADIINSLVTSLPAWETSIFTDTLGTGDVLDALGLPVAGTAAIGTLAAGFEISILRRGLTGRGRLLGSVLVAPKSGRSLMSGRTRRWLGLGLVATAGAGVVGLTAMMNPTVAHADGEDIGLVIGASGVPIPGALYVAAANGQYLDNQFTHFYPDLTFYGATSTVPSDNGFLWQGRLYAGGALSADRRRRPPIASELPHS